MDIIFWGQFVLLCRKLSNTILIRIKWFCHWFNASNIAMSQWRCYEDAEILFRLLGLFPNLTQMFLLGQ